MAENVSDIARRLAEGALGRPTKPEEDGQTSSRLPPAQLVDGATFAFDAPLNGYTLWGREDEVLASRGEPTLIVGPQGIGKTTLLQRFALARSGVRTPDIFGFPVESSDQLVVYVAADRPTQAQRSFRRMVDETDRDALRDRLLFWKGHLPFDIGRDPEALVGWATEVGAGTLLLDSLKDLAVGLSKDEIGSAVNRALQLVVAEGIEVVGNHHQRKASSDNRKPKSLDDVYGSNWITAGCGSVILLWGQPGDPVVELSHLKQPSSPVGPFQVDLDHDAGTAIIAEGTDLLAMLRASSGGLTARDAARLLFGSSEPSAAEDKKARRKLERYERDRLAYRREESGTHQGALKEPDRWFATPPTGAQEHLA